MTIQELYDYAKKNNMQNAEIVIGYCCDSCWYGVDAQKLTPEMLSLGNKGGKYGREWNIPGIFITLDI